MELISFLLHLQTKRKPAPGLASCFLPTNTEETTKSLPAPYELLRQQKVLENGSRELFESLPVRCSVKKNTSVRSESHRGLFARVFLMFPQRRCVSISLKSKF